MLAAASKGGEKARIDSLPPRKVFRDPLESLDTEELMPPHRPLSEVTATVRFFSTSAAAQTCYFHSLSHVQAAINRQALLSSLLDRLI